LDRRRRKEEEEDVGRKEDDGVSQGHAAWTGMAGL